MHNVERLYYRELYACVSRCDLDPSPSQSLSGRKKSKLKSLKSRLFGRSKRAGAEEKTKLSQSTSDITAGKGLGSDEDLACSQGMMGSRAFSHDSIFLADLVLSDAEPARVLSQENVHSKIKDLQMKLQQQKMHLGPPPPVPPVRRPEELCGHSEDDGLPHSPSEISGCDITTGGALSMPVSQPSYRPLSPILKPVSTKSVPPNPSHTFPLSVPANPSPSAVEPPLDFSSPVQFTPCLDMSAARHRMSIKPRNQRASTKKRLTAHDSNLHTVNNIDHPESEKEEEQQFTAVEEVTLEKEQGRDNAPMTSQELPSKSPELVSITSEAAPKSSSLPFSQQDPVLPGRSPSISSQILRVKPPRHGDIMQNERPHSSFIPSELKETREGLEEFEIQVMSYDKRNSLNKADINSKEVSSDQLSAGFGSVVAPRSSSVYQQVQSEPENIIGIKRPAPGSGSFKISISTAKSRDNERPRSGSFVLEQVATWKKTGGGSEDTVPPSMKEREERKDFQPRGGPIAVGRLRQEVAPHKSSVPWDRGDSLKKVESVTPPKNVTTDAGVIEGEEMESSQELVEEAVEAKEFQDEEGKTTFGVKLRSTSLSMRNRSDAPSNHHSKPLSCEEQRDKQKTQEISDNADNMSKTLPTSTSGDVRATEPTPSGFSLPVKNNPPSSDDSHTIRTEVQTSPKEVEAALCASQEPQPAPQTASSEVSWMSLAMEKTRSIQQLFTSRFPRDFTGGQAVPRPQVQVQPTNQRETSTGSQIQTQTVKLQQSTAPLLAARQPLTDTVKAEPVQSRGQSLIVKSSIMPTMQEKSSTMSPVQSNTSKEQQMSKQVNEHQLHSITAQPVSHSASHSAVQTNLWTTQSPLRSSPQTVITTQFAQTSATQTLAQSYLSSGQQQPPWSNRVLQPSNQPKSTTSAPTLVSTASTAAAPSLLSALGRGEKTVIVLEKESPPLQEKQTVWDGSIKGDKAAFLEKRAQWTTLPGTKGVEVRKTQTEMQTSGESPASVKPTPVSKDTKLEGRQGVNLAESSPTRVPDRPREDKWPRKNVGPSSSPSSSPILPSTLQSMSESGQPSWMELAKRKSMAWSDKTMD
ncbi:CRACD-like protein [Scomber scombrus]|uniref:CRACD-like protein n=1 Tax=Scomber scombrus TaxID=13677 RepID=A0AAV1NJ83_SCOSC